MPQVLFPKQNWGREVGIGPTAQEEAKARAALPAAGDESLSPPPWARGAQETPSPGPPASGREPDAGFSYPDSSARRYSKQFPAHRPDL